MILINNICLEISKSIKIKKNTIGASWCIFGLYYDVPMSKIPSPKRREVFILFVCIV